MYFDRVRYGTQLTGDTSQNRQGLGGGIKLKQLFGGNFKLWGEVSVRKIYDSYEGGISWLPLPRLLGLELDVSGQHVVFHNSMPNNSNVSFQVKWLPDANPHYDENFDWQNKHLHTVSQWVKTPAVYMPQVLAIAEQITTRLILLTITSINPNNGPTAGGNTVTITGSHFVNGLMVFFGGQLANVIVLLSPTTLTVEVPSITGSSVPQPVDVVIESPDGQQAILSNGYTYNSLPSIASIVPSLGPLGGGVPVTISGTGFVNGQTTVTFGGNAGTVTNVSSDGTQVTVITPAGTAGGVVDVVVTTPGGGVTQTGGYTYVNEPDISSLSPAFGPVAGGTQVTITGTDFIGATSVTFGGFPGTNINVNGSGTQLTVTAPASTAGTVQVVVTSPDGSSPLNPPTTTYTYVAVPAITGISPSLGPLGGGVPVTISGTGFVNGQTTVTFGGNAGTVTNVSSNGTQLTVTAPAHTAGTVNVVVTTPGGSVTQTGGYTYVNEPSISSLSPAFGPVAGGTQVTIMGTGFTGATSVTFGEIPGTNVSVNGGGTQITVTTPAAFGPAGPVNVEVTTPGGSSGVDPSVTTYTYVAVPTVTSIPPLSGPLGGGTSVTISGIDFVNGQTTVTFGGNAGTVTNVSSNGTQLTVTEPAHTAGSV